MRISWRQAGIALCACVVFWGSINKRIAFARGIASIAIEEIGFVTVLKNIDVTKTTVEVKPQLTIAADVLGEFLRNVIGRLSIVNSQFLTTHEKIGLQKQIVSLYQIGVMGSMRDDNDLRRRTFYNGWSPPKIFKPNAGRDLIQATYVRTDREQGWSISQKGTLGGFGTFLGGFGGFTSFEESIFGNLGLAFYGFKRVFSNIRLTVNVLKSFVRNISLSVYSAPLSPSEERVRGANEEQSDINQHRWRIPGFLIGTALFISGFILLGYSAKCFDQLSLKLRGFIWLIIGGFLYILGGSLMFIGPYLL